MMTGKLNVTTPTDRTIAMTRQFNAPRAAVFDAWTKPELLKQWMFGPDGHVLETCEINLRVGGTLRFVWRFPDGNSMGMSGVYKEIAPPARLVHTELFDQDWTGGETIVTNDFAEHNGITTATITITYASKEARDGALKTPMAEGMEMGHVRLDALLEGRPGYPGSPSRE